MEIWVIYGKEKKKSKKKTNEVEKQTEESKGEGSITSGHFQNLDLCVSG